MTVRVDARLGRRLRQARAVGPARRAGCPRADARGPRSRPLVAAGLPHRRRRHRPCARAPWRRSTCTTKLGDGDGTLRWLLPPDLLEERAAADAAAAGVASGRGSEPAYAQRHGEAEGGALALDRFEPDAAAVGLGDVARDGQAQTRSRRGRAGGPGRPCRSARRRDPGPSAGCPCRGRSRRPRPRRAARRVVTVTAPPSGENLMALWSRFMSSWSRRSSSPRTGGRSSGTSSHEDDALALREGAQAVQRRGDERRQEDLVAADRRGRLLDARQVEQLVDHLDEVAGLDVDGGDALADARRETSSRSRSSMSISVSSRMLASGVRSSWLRLSMNSLRMRRRRCSSVTSSSVTQAPPPAAGLARTRTLARSAAARARDRRSRRRRQPHELFEVVVDEGAP